MNEESVVLVIEDDAGISKMLRSIFSIAKVNAVFAENGTQGLALLKQHNVGMILCDIMLPDIIGYDILKQVRVAQQTGKLDRYIPFVFLTAFADPADVKRGMDAGADDYLTKPFAVAKLLSVTKQYMAKSA